jgi:hypothetical protein
MDSSPLPDFRARLLARSVSTHASVSPRRRPTTWRGVRAFLERLGADGTVPPGARRALGTHLRLAATARWSGARVAPSATPTSEGVDASPEQGRGGGDRSGIAGVRRGDLREDARRDRAASLDAMRAVSISSHYFSKPEQMASAAAVLPLALGPGRAVPSLHVPNVARR